MEVKRVFELIAVQAASHEGLEGLVLGLEKFLHDLRLQLRLLRGLLVDPLAAPRFREWLVFRSPFLLLLEGHWLLLHHICLELK